MLIIGLGDFTRALIDDPPKYVWTRLFKATGVSYLFPIYNRMVAIVTGTGVGVSISTLLQKQHLNILLIWIGKDLRKTFGDEVVDLVEKWPAHKLQIIDTPNVPELAVASYREYQAQAVFIGSNPKTVQGTIDYCHANGIAAFGPIWDS